MEDHINAYTVLSDLVEYKAIYSELTSQRCLDLFNQYLNANSRDSSSKVYIYLLLTTIIDKYTSNESYQKRINISSFKESVDDVMLEDEDVLEYSGGPSELPAFIKEVVRTYVKRELSLQENIDTQPRETTYSKLQKPFGMLRTRIVEFLAKAFSTFTNEVLESALEVDLFNILLHYFQEYPYHNILHNCVSDIFITIIQKESENSQSRILDGTNLIRMILEASDDQYL